MAKSSKPNPFEPRQWHLAHGETLMLGPKSLIMGILNVTPDSFSDGGRFDDPGRAIDHALQMIEEGADIVDVGGETTRPGFDATEAGLEQSRVLPIIERLTKQSDAMLSIDTYRVETARLAIEAGCHIINDVWGFQREPALAELAAETGAGCCLMHTGRGRERDPDVIADQHVFLETSIKIAMDAGVGREQIVLDPGFGFAKEPHENIALLARFEELLEFGFPVMTGTSRKRFIGHHTGREAEERAAGTAATNVIARMKGSTVFRVHDVAINKDALAMADAVLGHGQKEDDD